LAKERCIPEIEKLKLQVMSIHKHARTHTQNSHFKESM
jgi:hypothetical protein